MKSLKTLLRISIVFTVLCFYSCEERCSSEELQVLSAAENADINAIKSYFENGGDVLLECLDASSEGGRYGSAKALMFAVCRSKSKELITYFLEQNPPQYIKNDMLHFFLAEQNEALFRFMIKNNGHITYGKDCFGIDVSDNLELFKKADYNFNWINPVDGNTILIDYALCEATYEGADDEILKTIKFLVEEVGVRTDIKNKDGKTAKELAVNPKIKAYLESL
ncbi:hypothetical protein [Psychroserpens algicola]|uniref:hypothetical protein n=1 Tax=Psychroserpens algicola TaxID=1719034 RepID=UPI001954FD55|nr:hypothetical protein [Psychroserpens algicola]